MGFSLKSKYKSNEILQRRTEMINKEKLHIKDGISYERFLNLYNKYGEGFDEKEFAYAFLDIDDIKYNNLSSGKHSETAILFKQYVSDEEFENIRENLRAEYNKETVSYNKAVELHQNFGGVLSFKLFVEEILGLPDQIFKGKKLRTRNPDREIDTHFEIKPGSFGKLNGTEEIPMYVLNPEYILSLREKIVYEAGMHIDESISPEQFYELFDRYGRDMPEVIFAQEVLDLSMKSLTRMKSAKKSSPSILQNIDVPEEYIKLLRNKIIVINKLEGGQQLEYTKIKELHQKFGREFLEKRFAVEVLEVIGENYRPEEGKNSVRILNNRVTNYEAIRNKLIKEKKLHYDDMIDYQIFKQWHQEYAPNMSEVVFAEEVLDIRAANFMEVKHGEGRRARILLNLKLPTKEEINELRKTIILANKFHIMDEITYEELSDLHEKYGGIMSMEMFSTDVLLMSKTSGYRMLKKDYEENKDKEDYKPKKAYLLYNYQIPAEELEELKQTIKKNENLEEPRMMSKEDIESLYEKYGGILSFYMFLQGILGVYKRNFENLQSGLHRVTLVHIRERLDKEEIKDLKRLLAQRLTDKEISVEMGIPLATIRLCIKELIDKKELSNEDITYERIKVLKDEGNSLDAIAKKVGIGKDKTKELLAQYSQEKANERNRKKEKAREKKLEEKEEKRKAEIAEKAAKAIDDYKMSDRNIKNVRAYIQECQLSFEQGKLTENELDFLAECLIFVQCNSEDIEMFSKMCIHFYAYTKASHFIGENIYNDSILPEERTKLRSLREHIDYAIKKEKAAHMLRLGNGDARNISKNTGVRETDVMKLKRSLEEDIGALFIDKRPKVEWTGPAI